MPPASRPALAGALLVLLAGLAGGCSADTGGTSPGSGSGGSTGAAATVARVVDGDTVLLADGDTVRLIGIDTPEKSECGSREATVMLRDLVAGRQVTVVNPGSVQDTDRYDRLLRYLDAESTDAGLILIEAGLATARYDSRDGYDPHPREAEYRQADRAAPPFC